MLQLFLLFNVVLKINNISIYLQSVRKQTSKTVSKIEFFFNCDFYISVMLMFRTILITVRVCLFSGTFSNLLSNIEWNDRIDVWIIINVLIEKCPMGEEMFLNFCLKFIYNGTVCYIRTLIYLYNMCFEKMFCV